MLKYLFKVYFTVQWFQFLKSSLTFNALANVNCPDTEFTGKKTDGKLKNADHESPYQDQQCPQPFPLISLFCFPSPSKKNSAWTEMLRWALRQESPIFLGGQHLNKPFSFTLAPVSHVWLLLQQAAEPGFSYSGAGVQIWTVWLPNTCCKSPYYIASLQMWQKLKATTKQSPLWNWRHQSCAHPKYKPSPAATHQIPS